MPLAPKDGAFAQASCRSSSAFDAEGTEFYPAARAAAENAIRLDETLAEGHMVRGIMLIAGDLNCAGAERELLRKALLLFSVL